MGELKPAGSRATLEVCHHRDFQRSPSPLGSMMERGVQDGNPDQRSCEVFREGVLNFTKGLSVALNY